MAADDEREGTSRDVPRRPARGRRRRPDRNPDGRRQETTPSPAETSSLVAMAPAPDATDLRMGETASHTTPDDDHGFLLVGDEEDGDVAEAEDLSRGSLIPDDHRSVLDDGEGTGDGEKKEKEDEPLAKLRRRRIRAIAASLAVLALVIGIPLSLMGLVHGMLPGGDDTSSSSASTTSAESVVDLQKRHDPMPTVNLNASEIRTAIWGSSDARIGVTQEEAFADSNEALSAGAPSADLAIPNPSTKRSHHGWVKWYASAGHWVMATDNDDAYIENDFDPMETKTNQLDVAYDTGNYDVVHALWSKAQDMDSPTGYLIVASYKHAYYLVLEGKKGDWTPLRGINSSAPNPRNNDGYPVNMHFEGEMHGDDGPPQEDEGAYKPWKKPIYRDDTYYATNVYPGYGLLMHSYHTAWMQPTCVGAYGSVGWGWMLVQDSKWIWDNIPESTQCVYLTKSEVPEDRPSVSSVTPNGKWRKDSGGHWHYAAKDGSELEGFENDILEDGSDTGNMDPLHEMASLYADADSQTDYLIVVNWDTAYVGIFQGSAGKWVPVRSFNCSTGEHRQSWDDTVEGREWGGGWHGMGDGYWLTAIAAGGGFHTGPGVGKRASHNVGRVNEENAKWVWDNIPEHTRSICY